MRCKSCNSLNANKSIVNKQTDIRIKLCEKCYTSIVSYIKDGYANCGTHEKLSDIYAC